MCEEFPDETLFISFGNFKPGNVDMPLPLFLKPGYAVSGGPCEAVSG